MVGNKLETRTHISLLKKKKLLPSLFRVRKRNKSKQQQSCVGTSVMCNVLDETASQNLRLNKVK